MYHEVYPLSLILQIGSPSLGGPGTIFIRYADSEHKLQVLTEVAASHK